MKGFLCDVSDVDTLDVARRDHMEFFIESIINRHTILTRPSAHFLVYPDLGNLTQAFVTL